MMPGFNTQNLVKGTLKNVVYARNSLAIQELDFIRTEIESVNVEDLVKVNIFIIRFKKMCSTQ